MRLALGADGLPTGLRADMASPSLLEYSGLTNSPALDGFDWAASMGLEMFKYAVPAIHLGWSRVDHGVPCGYWRSVGASQNSFFLETLIDEAAAAKGMDPLGYRRQLLKDAARELAFLNALAAAADWNKTLPEGHARGHCNQ